MFIEGDRCLINLDDVSTIYIDQKSEGPAWLKARMKDGGEYVLGGHSKVTSLRKMLSDIADGISMGYEVYSCRYSDEVTA